MVEFVFVQVIGDLYQSDPLGVYLKRLFGGLLRYQFVDLGQSVSVGNPGISYSDLLILIPGSRAISICLFYAIHITKA